MNFSIFIDYASLYISIAEIRKLNGMRDKEKIENILIDIVHKVEKYVAGYYPYKKVNINSIKAYILPDRQFDIKESKLFDARIEGVRVESPKFKADRLKSVNGSRDDDLWLKLGVTECLNNNESDGVVIISNDVDFHEICNLVRRDGKYSWIVYYESKDTYVKKELKESADVALPIDELLSLKEAESKVRPKEERKYKSKPRGKRLEFYKDNELVKVYSLKRKSVSLGRRSVRRNHIPNVDFTEIDYDKILSRYHGDVHIIGEKIVFCVNEKCTRGTWYGKKAKRPNEQFAVKEGQPVLLGDKNGFVMYYFSK